MDGVLCLAEFIWNFMFFETAALVLDKTKKRWLAALIIFLCYIL